MRQTKGCTKECKEQNVENERQKKRQRKYFPKYLAAESSASKATLCSVINITAVSRLLVILQLTCQHVSKQNKPCTKSSISRKWSINRNKNHINKHESGTAKMPLQVKPRKQKKMEERQQKQQKTWREKKRKVKVEKAARGPSIQFTDHKISPTN